MDLKMFWKIAKAARHMNAMKRFRIVSVSRTSVQKMEKEKKTSAGIIFPDAGLLLTFKALQTNLMRSASYTDRSTDVQTAPMRHPSSYPARRFHPSVRAR